MLSALPENVVDGIVMERKRSLSVVLGFDGNLIKLNG